MYKKIQSHSTGGEKIRFFFLGLFFIGLFLLVLWKLFQLQVVQGEELQERAQNIRNSSISISARRGGIFVRDVKTENKAPVALNTTLYTVFFDARSGIDKNGVPFGTDPSDFPVVAQTITNILYTPARFKECIADSAECPKGSVIQVTGETEDDILLEKKPSYEEAKIIFQQNLLDSISEKRQQIIWATDVEKSILETLEQKNIPHLSVSYELKRVTIDLVNLNDDNRLRIAAALAEVFGGNASAISQRLYATRRGYVKILDRVYPEEVESIQEVQKEMQRVFQEEYARYIKQTRVEGSNAVRPKNPPLSGIGFEKDPLRYYPEGDLAAQIIGFVDREGVGQYGVERSADGLLKGEDGLIQTSRDVKGNAVGISREKTGTVTDGANITLTIDRTLQKTVEEILDEKIKEYKADSAQAIIIDPKTGEILTMASSPRFNPNFYGKIYERKKVEKEDIKEIYKTTPLEKRDEEGNFIAVDFEEFEKAVEENKYTDYYIFRNKVGPQSYIEPSTMRIYEPGSVMKPLVVAAAIQEGEVSPYDMFDEEEPREVGPFTIRNADGIYPNRQTVKNIVARSSNVGMSFIADTLGKPIMYDALKKFKFGEYTHIFLPEELSGNLPYHKRWSDARLYTVSFGQGISATPLQLVRAWTSLANDGHIVEPRIVSEIEFNDGSIEKTTISKSRIFEQKTIADMRDMLVYAVEKGVAKNAQMPNHYIAGKTGTSQIVGDNGKYESIEGDEKGTTITSFIGFLPVNDPQFLVYVKFDRPRRGMRDLDVFGSTTAAPTFTKIVDFLIEYYTIPADK